MSWEARKMKQSTKTLKISDVLIELERIRRIEDLGERIAAFEIFVPRIRDFAYQLEDRRIIETVERFAEIEDRSKAFYKVESLRKSLGDLKTNLEEARPFVSPEHVSNFLSCIRNFEETLIYAQRLVQPSVQALFNITEQLNHELIGRRLEKEIAPDLAKQLGYTPIPNILPDNGGEVEVDFLGERNTTTAPFGVGRLKKKEILVIECKTTVSKNDIDNFSKKLDTIRNKYKENADNFRYELVCRAWIFACYGWTEELIDFAKEKGIEPFGKTEITEALRRNGLLDRRIPICPQNV